MRLPELNQKKKEMANMLQDALGNYLSHGPESYEIKRLTDHLLVVKMGGHTFEISVRHQR